jgi:catechol 2,3-dioxygenase-like lactoylglutathione lyase family enzyme
MTFNGNTHDERNETMFIIESIHHVSIPVTDLERSMRFYKEVLGLTEIERPTFDFPGTWYQVGDRQLHLIMHNNSTFRERKTVDSRDIHFAIRVKSYRETRQFLRSKGFHPDAEDEFKQMKESPRSTAGWPQIYIMDPDRNVIELNAERLDEE